MDTATNTEPLFTDITVDGKAARISRIITVTPAQRGLRVPPQPHFAFRLVTGSVVKTFDNYRTREAAAAARDAIINPPVNERAQQSAIEDLATQHGSVKVEPCGNDGRLFVAVQGREPLTQDEYVIERNGSVTFVAANVPAMGEDSFYHTDPYNPS